MRLYDKILLIIFLLTGSSLKAQEIRETRTLEKGIKIVSIDNTESLSPGYSYEPKATFQNFSDEMQVVDITMEINKEYRSVKNLALHPGAAVVVIFDPLKLKGGEYDFKVCTYSPDSKYHSLLNTLTKSVFIPLLSETDTKSMRH